MLRVRQAVLWAACVVLLSGCGERLSEPEVPADPLAAATVDRPGPGKKPYACFISVATPGGPHKYRYYEIPLPFARKAVDAAEGRYGLFRYRRYNQGELLWLANCMIPYSDEAIRIAAERFEFRPAPQRETQQASLLPFGVVKRAYNLVGAVLAQLECGSYDNPCPIDPVVGDCGEYPDEPSCQDDPIEDDVPELDPSGGGDPGPCYDCTPSGGSTGGGGEEEPAVANVECMGGPRGSTVSCRVTVEPLSANLEVTRWRFMGGGFYVEENTSATTWSGIGVVSGRVFADFKLNGVSTYNYADLTVSARTSGIWTPSYWASQLMFTPGQGAQNCSGSAKVLSLMGWTGSLSKAQQGICDGQRIEPVGNAGYTLGSGGGPNAGIWYISGTSFFVHSTSQVHPDVFPNSQGYTLTSSQQASLCGSALNLPPGSPVTINFYNYNANCAKVPGWGGFIQAIWDHEEQHFRQGETALQHPGNNIYVALESVVEASQSDAALQVSTTYSPIQQALASAGGVEPTGNWTTPFWIWMSNTIHEFVPVPSPNF